MQHFVGGIASALLRYFDSKLAPTNVLPEGNKHFIIDGGFLLRKVVWQRPALFKDIISQYLKYVQYHYDNNCTIVFDGYNGQKISTKGFEHQRRAKNIQQEVNFTIETHVKISQTEFLTHPANKQKLINLLTPEFRNIGIPVKHAISDADYLIVVTATQYSSNSEDWVILVGQDTDLMVLLVEHCKKENLFMLRPGLAGKSDKLTNISQLQSILGETVVKNILFLHAISGCDTTSAFYKKGKKQH